MWISKKGGEMSLPMPYCGVSGSGHMQLTWWICKHLYAWVFKTRLQVGKPLLWNCELPKGRKQVASVAVFWTWCSRHLNSLEGGGGCTGIFIPGKESWSAVWYIAYIIALVNYPEQVGEGYSNRFIESVAEFLCQMHCGLICVCVLLLNSCYLLGQFTAF